MNFFENQPKFERKIPLTPWFLKELEGGTIAHREM